MAADQTSVVGNAIVVEVLKATNYDHWSCQVRTYLVANDLWDVVAESATEPPKEDDDEAEFRIWTKKNAAALHAIQISCGAASFSTITRINEAKIAWKTLAEKFDKKKSKKVEAVFDLSKYIKPGGVETSQNDEENKSYERFVDAVRNGKLSDAKNYLASNPGAVRKTNPLTGKTALHVAARAKNVEMVKELVRLMEKEDMEIRGPDGQTALAEAAYFGITKIAKCMVKKNRNIVSIATDFNVIPVSIALYWGHKDMARYLYDETPEEDFLKDGGMQGATLICTCIKMKCHDIALDLIHQCPHLAACLDNVGVSPLYELARTASAFRSGCRLKFWQQWIYDCVQIKSADHPIGQIRINVQCSEENQAHKRKSIVCVPDILQGLISNLLKLSGTFKYIYEMKKQHDDASELLGIFCEVIKGLDKSIWNETGVYFAIFQAVRTGNVEFITRLVNESTEFLWVTDYNKRGILMHAVLARQENMFCIISQLGDMRKAMGTYMDAFGNNVLHVAAELAPSSQLNCISGAALQMQRELQWFKEVEETIPLQQSVENNNNAQQKSAHELFTEKHKVLMKEGEKWMKETAASCTVVGALVITIMFAAIFTVPNSIGGTRFPIILDKKLYKVFIISDALSLFSSTTSVLMFLGILTSRYAEADFLKSLPTKMIIGLSSLFFSIATMMVVFCTTIFIMLEGELSIVIPIVMLAALPVTFFVMMQFPLLVEIFMSTYGPGIFNYKSHIGKVL